MKKIIPDVKRFHSVTSKYSLIEVFNRDFNFLKRGGYVSVGIKLGDEYSDQKFTYNDVVRLYNMLSNKNKGNVTFKSNDVSNLSNRRRVMDKEERKFLSITKAEDKTLYVELNIVTRTSSGRKYVSTNSKYSPEDLVELCTYLNDLLENYNKFDE